MMSEGIAERKQGVRASLFKGHENLTAKRLGLTEAFRLQMLRGKVQDLLDRHRRHEWILIVPDSCSYGEDSPGRTR